MKFKPNGYNSTRYIKTIHYRLHFGKYKNKTIKWILKNDPSYILWLDRNTQMVEFDPQVLKLLTNKLLSYAS